MRVKGGQSPIWIASYFGHQKCVEVLIKAGAIIDIPSEVSVSSCTYISETILQVITYHHILLVYRTLVVCGGAGLVKCPVCVARSEHRELMQP